MPWVETTSSGGDGERDALAKGTTSRVFRVWDVSPSQVLNDPSSVQSNTGEPLPGINSPHPDQPILRLDRYRIAGRIGVRAFDAVADYSNNRRFVFREIIDPTTPGFQSWSVSFKREAFEIPYAIKTVRTVPIPNQPPIVKNPWEKDIWRTPVTYTRITYRLNVTGFGAQQRMLIEEQTGKVHVINDTSYLFEAGDISQVDSNIWSVEYNWIRDSGLVDSPFDPVTNPQLDPNVTGPLKVWSAGYPPFIGLWTRPPFCTVLGPVFSGGDVSSMPDFPVIVLYDRDDNGWQNLPGI